MKSLTSSRRWLSDDVVARLPLLVTIAAAAFTILTFYPGFMSHDSFRQMEQARTGVLSDSHPPLLVYFWVVAEFFVVGPFLMLVGQVTLVYSGLLLVSREVSGGPWMRSALVLFVAVYPPTASILGTVWKDIWMVGFLLWAVYLATRAYHADKNRHWWGLGAIVAMWLAAGMRHNAVAAIVPVAVVVAWIMLPTWFGERSWLRLGTATAAGVLVSVALFGLVSAFSAAVVDKSGSVWQVLADYDLAGISVRQGELLVPEHRLRAGTTLADVEGRYSERAVMWLYSQPCEGTSPECAAVFRTTTNDAWLEDLRATWVTAIAEHPTSYLAHRMQVFQEVIGLTDNRVWAPFYDDRFTDRLRDAEWVTPPSRFAAMVGGVYERLGQTSLYKVWLYLLGLVGLAVPVGIAVVRSGGRDGVAAAILTTSGLLYVASYYPLAASPDYRYSHWAVLCLVLVVFGMRDVAGSLRNSWSSADQ